MPYYVHDLHPDISGAIALFQHLNEDELKEILNNDERIEMYVKDLHQIKQAEAEREILLMSNKSLAEFNLSLEPKLTQSREQLLDLFKEAVDLKEQVEEKKKKLDEKSQQMSLDTTLALLQTATAQLEEETESIADNFLAGQLSVEHFCEMFLEKRKTMHLRRVKTDKMPDILAKCTRERQNMNAATISPVPVRIAPPRPAPPPPNQFPPYWPPQENMPYPPYRPYNT